MANRQLCAARPSLNAIAKALFAVLIVWAAVFVPPMAHAQTDEEPPPDDSLQFFRKTEGPYDIAIRVQPRLTIVGPIHLVITVLDALTSSPMHGATVTILAENPDGELIAELRAFSTPAVPGDYHADLTVLFSGVWLLDVEVSKERLGVANFKAPFLVDEPPPPPGQTGSLLWVLVFGALIGGVLYLWNKSRKLTRYR